MAIWFEAERETVSAALLIPTGTVDFYRNNNLFLFLKQKKNSSNDTIPTAFPI